MEFLRFGSSIPGAYWGCCAVCIIQNFKMDPDAKAGIELVSGDGGQPLFHKKAPAFVGPTYKDIFLQRLRIGTFSTDDMPNHAFFAILTEEQVCGGYGKKWLKILKEQGFEFIRSVSNSVYTGPKLTDGTPSSEYDEDDDDYGEDSGSEHPNYIFALIRNIGRGNMRDPFTPPKVWTDLEKVVPEAWEQITDTKALTQEQIDAQLKLWDNLPPKKFMTVTELEEQGVPVWLAGRRSDRPQQLKANRKETKAAPNPFSTIVAPSPI